MNFKFIVLFFAFCSSTPLFGQSPASKWLQEELSFAQHLALQGNKHDAIYVLSQEPPFELERQQLDSIDFNIGWYYYEMKELDQSYQHLKNVSIQSAYYHQSQFFSAFNLAFTNRAPQARQFLLEIELPDGDAKLQQLRNFEYAGLSLLERDYTSFDSCAALFNNEHYAFAKQQDRLKEMKTELMNMKRKSPFLGGLFSAVVPGTGKIYAGRLGEGLAAFSVVSVLGLATFETLKTDKRNNIIIREDWVRETDGIPIQTYIFGSLFTMFYIGNIYGSVYAVKIEHNNRVAEVENQILFDLHIPLRTIFN